MNSNNLKQILRDSWGGTRNYRNQGESAFIIKSKRVTISLEESCLGILSRWNAVTEGQKLQGRTLQQS